MVGSELLTGLSAAASVTDQLFLDSGSTLGKVGHGAGQSGVFPNSQNRNNMPRKSNMGFFC